MNKPTTDPRTPVTDAAETSDPPDAVADVSPAPNQPSPTTGVAATPRSRIPNLKYSQFVTPGNLMSPKLRGEIAEKRAQLASMFNEKALTLISKLGDADERASRQRWAVMVILAVLTVGGTLAIIAGIMLASSTETITVVLSSAGVVITTLVVAGVTNPLQTIERDLVVRRWSDVILSSFYLQAGSFDLKENAEWRRSAARASKDFAALAAVLGAAHGRTLDALLAVLKTAGAEEEDDAGAAVTLVNPGDQQSTLTQINPFTLVGTGPDPLTYEIEGGPLGITVNADTGEVSGTPTTAGTYTTTASVASSKVDEMHAVLFTWTVS